MNRSEKRRKTREIQKKVKDIPVSEFSGIMEQSIGDATEKGWVSGWEKGSEAAMHYVEKILREDFGFGDKRIGRLTGKVWDELCLDVETWEKKTDE